MRLRDMAVRNAKPGAKSYKLADGGGLYLQVSPSGGKLWRWDYRYGGKRKTMAFGTYPDVALLQARDRHQSARRLLADGIDPMEHRKGSRVELAHAADLSFANVAQRWYEHWRVGKSTRHAASTHRRLVTNVFPHIGAVSVRDLSAKQLVAVVSSIQERGARDIAKRALETCGQILRFAVAHGLIERNAAADLRPGDILQKIYKRNYARIEAKELPTLLREIQTYRGRHVTRLAMQILALTFVRTGELIGAMWSEIDFDNARWLIPAERMKMRSSHIVPLARQALDSLDELRFITGQSRWLFPGEGLGSNHMSNNTILKALERMGYKGLMTGHGFRGLASTVLHEQEYPHDWIELQLAHAKRNTVSAAYNHAQHLSGRAKMMQEWADFLEQQRRSASASALIRPN